VEVDGQHVGSRVPVSLESIGSIVAHVRADPTLQQQARALGDPTRHRIFRHVLDAGAPVDVEELTAAFGLNHNAIRQHLAKLVDAGLVVEAKAASRGPGRPRLVYTVDPAADSRWGAIGPYERLSMLLTEIIRTGETAVEVGRRAGGEIAVAASPSDATVADIADAMAREGFEPVVSRRGNRVDMVLQRCPFESAVLTDADVICDLHLGLAEGLVEGAGDLVLDELVAKDPRRAGCRLRFHVEPD
jgi:predicted ArsR family transcriptional regulator